MSLSLRRFLYSQYGGFGDKRVKDVTRDYPFKVDDQKDTDAHELFCGIFVQVQDDDRFALSLTNNAPITASIGKLIKGKAGKVVKMEDKSHIDVDLSVKDIKFIRMLSQLISDTVAPGKRYNNRHWKWLCPRTSASLNRLITNLVEYNES